jgi:hypothetical protein
MVVLEFFSDPDHDRRRHHYSHEDHQQQSWPESKGQALFYFDKAIDVCATINAQVYRDK